MYLVPQYSMLSTTFTSFIFGLVFLFLAKQSNKKYLALWGSCWLLYSLMFFVDFSNFSQIQLSTNYITERQITALIASFLFLLGAYNFFNKKAPRILYYTTTLALSIIICIPPTVGYFWVFAIPTIMYSSLLLVFAGCMFITFSWTQNLPEKIFASFLIFLWAIFLNNFGFSSNIDSIGLYNYFIGILLVNLLTIFLMIIHFKKLTFLIEKHEVSLKKAADSRRELIENISHEVRTPITLIQGYAESLINGMVPPSATNTYLKMIRSKTLVVTTLLEDLIQVSHLTSQTLEFKFYEVNVHEFFDEIISQAEFQIETAGRIFKSSNDTDKSAVVIIDSTRIHQVITNLINNSVRHTPLGKEIRIDCFTIPTSIENSYDNLDFTIPDGDIHFTISDEGAGIDPLDLPKIFERRYSGNANSKNKSTGLGLFISREIVNQHSGRIWAKNNVKGGATLSFTIPYYLSGEE